MVVTGTSSVTTFGTQTFLQTVRVDIAGAPQPPTEEPQPHPEDTAGAPQPHPEETAGAQPHPEDATGAPQPQPEEAAGAHPQPEEAATPHPLATGTSSVTVWYEPISLVTVRVL